MRAEMGLAISPRTAGVFGGNDCLFLRCGQDGTMRTIGRGEGRTDKSRRSWRLFTGFRRADLASIQVSE
jgi:hypothetical protein